MMRLEILIRSCIINITVLLIFNHQYNSITDLEEIPMMQS